MDLFATLRELTHRREQVVRRLEECRDLSREKEILEAQIAEVAELLVRERGRAPGTQALSPANDTDKAAALRNERREALLAAANEAAKAAANKAANAELAERVAARVLDLPPRHRKLLELVARYPRKPYSELCQLMYGRSDEAAHSTLSAELSLMRSVGLVESVGRGQYVATPFGLHTLKGGP